MAGDFSRQWQQSHLNQAVNEKPSQPDDNMKRRVELANRTCQSAIVFLPF